MGLAIVSEITGRYGGDVEVKSDEKETVFTVIFEKGEQQWG